MKFRIAIAMLVIYTIWGSTYLAIRIAVESIPPFLMAGTRFLVSGLILLIWRWIAGDPFPTRKQWISAGIIGTFLLLGGNGLVSWSEKRIDSGIAALLVGTAPIWMVLSDALFSSRKKPRWQELVGLFIGLVGVIILIGPKNLIQGESHYDILGIGAVLLGAFLWSVGSVYGRNADLPKSPLLGTGMEMLVGCFGLYLVSILSGEWKTFNFSDLTVRSGLGLLYLVILGSLGGFVAYNWLLRNAPISLVSTYAYVNPLVAILLGNWLVKEPITSQTLIAAAVIMGSVILVTSRKRKAILKS